MFINDNDVCNYWFHVIDEEVFVVVEHNNENGNSKYDCYRLILPSNRHVNHIIRIHRVFLYHHYY